jgi:hypothetical protein
MNPVYFDYFLIFVCNVIGGDGIPPDGVVFPTTTNYILVLVLVLHTTYCTFAYTWVKTMKNQGQIRVL